MTGPFLKSLPEAPPEVEEPLTNQRDQHARVPAKKIIDGSDRAIFRDDPPSISFDYRADAKWHDIPGEKRSQHGNVGRDKIHAGRNQIFSQDIVHRSKQDPGHAPAWAQQGIEPTLRLEAIPQDPLHGPNRDPVENCCLYGKYCPIKFESFLVEANLCEGQFVSELAQALDELVRWESDAEPYCARKQISGYEVIRVTAPPGYGKSALFRYLNDILKPGSKITGTRPCQIRDILACKDYAFIQHHFYTIKLDELGTNFAVRSTMLDDLKNDDGFPRPAFGKLRAFDYDDHAAPGVEYLVKNLTSAREFDSLVLIIDSIDELHPDSAKSLLQRIDDYIKQRKKEEENVDDARKRFLRIFIVGCPEGFTDYYRIAQGGVPKTRPVKLSEPCYHSCDDLVCAARSVVRFNILGRSEDSCVEDPCDEQAITKMAVNAIKFAEIHPWLQDSFYNLAQFGDLIRFADVYKGRLRLPRSLRDEYQLKEVFLNPCSRAPGYL